MAWCEECECERFLEDIPGGMRCPVCGTEYTYDEVDDMMEKHPSSDVDIPPEKWRDFEDGWRP